MNETVDQPITPEHNIDSSSSFESGNTSEVVDISTIKETPKQFSEYTQNMLAYVDTIRDLSKNELADHFETQNKIKSENSENKGSQQRTPLDEKAKDFSKKSISKKDIQSWINESIQQNHAQQQAHNEYQNILDEGLSPIDKKMYQNMVTNKEKKSLGLMQNLDNKVLSHFSYANSGNQKYVREDVIRDVQRTLDDYKKEFHNDFGSQQNNSMVRNVYFNSPEQQNFSYDNPRNKGQSYPPMRKFNPNNRNHVMQALHNEFS